MKIKLAILLFISFNGLSFFARWIEDPKEFCGEDKNLIDTPIIYCDKNVIPLPEVDLDLNKINNSLDENFNNDVNDLLSTRALSAKILSESKEATSSYNDIKDGKSEKSKRERLRINSSLNALLSLEFKIQELSAWDPRFQTSRGTRVPKKEQEKRKKKRDALKLKKALIISENPVLAQDPIQNLIGDKVGQRIKNHTKAIRGNYSNRKELLKKREDDNYFSIKEEAYLEELDESLGRMIISSEKLTKRHEKALSKIKMATPENAKFIRDNLMYNKDLIRDYFIAADPSNPNSDFFNNRGVACRLAGEFDASELNSLFNSLALDIALTVIPVGGPLLMGKALGKLSKIKSLPTALQKIAHADSSAIYSTIGVELGVMGIDTSLIADDMKRCEELRNLKYSFSGLPSGLEEKAKECDDMLNDMILSYAAGMITGATLSAKLLKGSKNILKNSSKVSKQDKLYLINADSIYEDFKCHDNIHRLAKKFDASGVDLSDAKVLYLIPDGIDSAQKLPYRFGRGEAAKDGVSWNHHVVMIKDGKVYDPDFPRDEIPSVEEYMTEMFPDVMRSGESSLANVRVKEVDASDYIANFEGGDTAAGNFASTDIRTVENETSSIGDYFNRFAKVKLEVPSVNIPRAYDQFGTPLFRSPDGRGLVDSDGDLVSEGRVETLDGDSLWLDDEGVIDKVLGN